MPGNSHLLNKGGKGIRVKSRGENRSHKAGFTDTFKSSEHLDPFSKRRLKINRKLNGRGKRVIFWKRRRGRAKKRR